MNQEENKKNLGKEIQSSLESPVETKSAEEILEENTSGAQGSAPEPDPLPSEDLGKEEASIPIPVQTHYRLNNKALFLLRQRL